MVIMVPLPIWLVLEYLKGYRPGGVRVRSPRDFFFRLNSLLLKLSPLHEGGRNMQVEMQRRIM